MGIPSASYSITMRVHLGADPLGIGRITTAVGEAAESTGASSPGEDVEPSASRRHRPGSSTPSLA